MIRMVTGKNGVLHYVFPPGPGKLPDLKSGCAFDVMLNLIILVIFVEMTGRNVSLGYKSYRDKRRVS
jgi:hypothetical protein